MKIVELEQGSKEWLEFRRMGIGASDAPSIMGVGFKNPYQLFMDKMTGKESFVNAAMQRGKDLEPVARDEFSKLTGISIQPAVVVNDTYAWQFASLDGIDSSNSVLVEIKCPGAKDHMSAKNGVIPQKYIPQLQHQFSVTGLQKGYYYSFDGSEGVLLEINRDDKYIENLLEKEKEFYQRMLNFDPPQLLKEDVVVIDDPEWNAVGEEYSSIRKDLDILEEKEKLLKDRLISIAAERNVESSGIRLTKVLRKGSIDYSKIPELKHVNMEAYRKSTICSWKISVL